MLLMLVSKPMGRKVTRHFHDFDSMLYVAAPSKTIIMSNKATHKVNVAGLFLLLSLYNSDSVKKNVKTS